MTRPVSVIEVLGPGCARCFETFRVVRHVVDEAQLDCLVQKDESVERMAALGVTWNSVGMPGDSLERAVEALQRYGEEVIGPGR